MGSLRLTFSALYTRLSGFVGHVSLGCVSRETRISYLDVCSCHVLRIFGGCCKIWDICCLSAPAPAHQPFSSISLDLSAPEEAYIRNERASGTLKFGYEDIFKLKKKHN